MVKFEKDSSLSCIYYLGSGTILGSFISGCNMKATSTRICFIVVRQIVKIWTKFPAVGALPIKSIIFELSAKLLTRFSVFSKFRTGLSKTGSSMEHSRKVCKTVIYHRQFGLILTQTWATLDHTAPALSATLRAQLQTIHNDTLIHPSTAAVPPLHEHAGDSLILQVSAERAYWSLKDRNVVKTVWWVWEDSSLSVFIHGSGAICRKFRFWL